MHSKQDAADLIEVQDLSFNLNIFCYATPEG